MDPTAFDLQVVWNAAFDMAKECMHAPASFGKESCRTCEAHRTCRLIAGAREKHATSDSRGAPPRFSDRFLNAVHASGATMADVRRLFEFVYDDGVKALHEGRVVVTIPPEKGS